MTTTSTYNFSEILDIINTINANNAEQTIKLNQFVSNSTPNVSWEHFN